jgi:sulfonate transport system substrate-binding protein
MFNSKSLTAALVLLIIIALSAWYYFSVQKKEPPVTSPADTVAVCHSARPDTLIILAENQGFFRREGADVILKKYSSGGRSLEAMLKGECEMSTSGTTPIAYRSFTYQDFKIIATVGSSGNTGKIIARKDRGISSPADLGGKTIAVQKGTLFHFFLHLFLLKHGLAERVNIVFENAEEMDPAEAWKRFDAICTKEPHLTTSRNYLKKNAIVFEDKGLILDTLHLTASNKLIRERPGVIKKIIAALLKAEEFAKADPQQAKNIIKQFHGIGNNYIDSYWQDIDIAVSLDQSTLQTLEEMAQWVIYDKLTDKAVMPNYLDFVHIDALASLKPEAVTILR